MKPIQPVFEGEERVVPICFNCDKNYVPYLKVALYSLLCNCDTSCYYDILILHKDIGQEGQDSICTLLENRNRVRIRFVDITSIEDKIVTEMNSYYLIATNYRLFLFSDLFLQYDKVLYLDCDIIVRGDVSELYYSELNGNMIGAVKGVIFRYMAYSKSAIFVNNVPYNVVNYVEKYLGVKHIEDYFNTGVMLIDLKKCREKISFEELLFVLHQKVYCYHDQDVLNILMDGSVEPFDCKWNYTNDIEYQLTLGNEMGRKLYKDLKRKDFKIIHYISRNKPWNKSVPLDGYYKKYANEMDEFYKRE